MPRDAGALGPCGTNRPWTCTHRPRRSRRLRPWPRRPSRSSPRFPAPPSDGTPPTGPSARHLDRARSCARAGPPAAAHRRTSSPRRASPQCVRSARSSKRNVSIDSEALGLDLRVAKPELVLHSIGHRRIDLGEARAKPTGQLSHRGFVVLRLRRRYGVEARRRSAAADRSGTHLRERSEA